MSDDLYKNRFGNPRPLTAEELEAERKKFNALIKAQKDDDKTAVPVPPGGIDADWIERNRLARHAACICWEDHGHDAGCPKGAPLLGALSEAELRKATPIASGVLDYFPLAIAEVARASYAATQQHHPDKPMHWDRDKSFDHADCLVRHLIERGTLDTDGQRHSAKAAWRALALLQLELENENASR